MGPMEVPQGQEQERLGCQHHVGRSANASSKAQAEVSYELRLLARQVHSVTRDASAGVPQTRMLLPPTDVSLKTRSVATMLQHGLWPPAG